MDTKSFIRMSVLLLGRFANVFYHYQKKYSTTARTQETVNSATQVSYIKFCTVKCNLNRLLQSYRLYLSCLLNNVFANKLPHSISSKNNKFLLSVGCFLIECFKSQIYLFILRFCHPPVKQMIQVSYLKSYRIIIYTETTFQYFEKNL